MRPSALGMIETRGMLGAVEAADAAVKAAAVSLVGVRKVSGGVVTVFVTGDVGAVRAAVDGAAAATARLGIACVAHVIPRPAPEVGDLLVPENPQSGDRPPRPLPEGPRERPKGSDPALEEPPEAPAGASEQKGAPGGDLEGMTVMELRRLARRVGIDSMNKRQIRFAGKAELIRELAAFFRRTK